VDNLLTVTFEAHHPGKNHHRRYEVMIGRDLLDHRTVTIRFGRAGQAGRVMRYAAVEADAVMAIIRERLTHRLSAPKRIDCAYRMTTFSADTRIDTTQ